MEQRERDLKTVTLWKQIIDELYRQVNVSANAGMIHSLYKESAISVSSMHDLFGTAMTRILLTLNVSLCLIFGICLALGLEFREMKDQGKLTAEEASFTNWIWGIAILCILVLVYEEVRYLISQHKFKKIWKGYRCNAALYFCKYQDIISEIPTVLRTPSQMERLLFAVRNASYSTLGQLCFECTDGQTEDEYLQTIELYISPILRKKNSLKEFHPGKKYQRQFHFMDKWIDRFFQ